MKYEMTAEQFQKLLKRCTHTPVMLIGGVNIGASAQENANKAWAQLGNEMGFDPMSVQPDSAHGVRFFTANPVTPPKEDT